MLLQAIASVKSSGDGDSGSNGDSTAGGDAAADAEVADSAIFEDFEEDDLL